jgi:hypothetical protein
VATDFEPAQAGFANVAATSSRQMRKQSTFFAGTPENAVLCHPCDNVLYFWVVIHASLFREVIVTRLLTCIADQLHG